MPSINFNGGVTNVFRRLDDVILKITDSGTIAEVNAALVRIDVPGGRLYVTGSELEVGGGRITDGFVSGAGFEGTLGGQPYGYTTVVFDIGSVDIATFQGLRTAEQSDPRAIEEWIEQFAWNIVDNSTEATRYWSNGTLSGGEGVRFDRDDQIALNEGDDVFWAALGDDTVEGGAGADRLHGSGGDDRIFGGTDDDTLFGGADGDYLAGGTGDDFLFGQGGDDDLLGGQGDDKMLGGAGNDRIVANGDFFGNAGTDLLIGGAGDDTLVGGTTLSKMLGGAGVDLFEFLENDIAPERSVIFDFDVATELVRFNLRDTDEADVTLTDVNFGARSGVRLVADDDVIVVLDATTANFGVDQGNLLLF